MTDNRAVSPVIERHKDTLIALAEHGRTQLADDSRKLLSEEGIEVGPNPHRSGVPEEPTPPETSIEAVREPEGWDGKWVYVAEATPGRLKIGMSGNPEKRVESLQRGSPYELELLLAIGVDKPRTLENWIHMQFTDYNVTGEWFDFPEEEVSQVIDSIRSIGNISGLGGGGSDDV